MSSEPSEKNEDEFGNDPEYDRPSGSTHANVEFDRSPTEGLERPTEIGDRNSESDLNDPLVDEMDEDLASGSEVHHSRKRKKLYCFGCNRQEGHYLSQQDRWYFSYMLGLTFGLMRFIGPFRCQCCGSQRLMWADQSNIRYLLRTRGPATTKKSRKSSSRKSRTERNSRR